MNDTRYIRYLSHTIDRARREGWPSFERSLLVEALVNAAEEVRAHEDATIDEAEWRQGYILALVRSGRCPVADYGAVAFDYFTPRDIRDEYGRFLTKRDAEAIYRAWRDHGSTDDVAWFLALAPRRSLVDATQL